MMKKRLVILGGGESGTGTAVLAQLKGFEVFLSVKGMLKDKYVEELEQHGIQYEMGGHTEADILNADDFLENIN